MSHTTEVMAIFVRLFAYFGHSLMPWQRSLDPCDQKYLLWID